jgi:hypothetical protein
MRLIDDYYKPDLIMIPIVGHFVMDPRDAAYATKEMLSPRSIKRRWVRPPRASFRSARGTS